MHEEKRKEERKKIKKESLATKDNSPMKERRGPNRGPYTGLQGLQQRYHTELSTHSSLASAPITVRKGRHFDF